MSSFTVKEALLQCLASISSIGSYAKPQMSKVESMFTWHWETLTQLLYKKKQKSTRSNVIIIGTCKDKLGDGKKAEDQLQYINNQLKDEVRRTDLYSKNMVIPADDGRLFLGVDSFSPNDLKKVKDQIKKAQDELSIPVSLLTFMLCIRKLGKRVMSLKECQGIAQICKISEDFQFDSCLLYLHQNFGMVRYYKNVPELQNLVITDPQLLFDIVTDIVVNTFSFGKHIKRMSEHDRFRSSGRFTKHHLEQCEAVKEKLLSVEQVIAVLEHLLIIAPVGRNEYDEQEYFLPCVLISASSRLLHNDSDIPPLLITFKCDYTPRGVFSSLIAKILLDGRNKWELSSEKIFRDQVEFCLVESGHIVIITNFFRFIKIAVKSPSGFSATDHGNIYFYVQQYISQCLTYVKYQLNYTDATSHIFGFICREHMNSSIQDHPAICNRIIRPIYTSCIHESLKAYLLPQQQLWFQEKSEL